jgi:hypothetical protein
MKRLIVVLVAIVSLLTLTVPAQASTPGCNSERFSIGLWGGGEKVGVLHEAATRCWNSHDHLTDGTGVDGVYVDNTFAGWLYGFSWNHIGPYLIHRDRYTWEYRTDFSTRPCLAKHLMICGHTARFSVLVTLVQPRYVQSYWGRYLWGIPFCTNSWCHDHMKFGD